MFVVLTMADATTHFPSSCNYSHGMELVRELLQFQASGENDIVYIFQLSLDSGDLNAPLWFKICTRRLAVSCKSTDYLGLGSNEIKKSSRKRN